jgi:DNA polymerase-4
MTQRKIIHIDMDAFFASVEQRDNPDLRGKPVIVGGKPNSRGVVAACSYEARKFGIHSAMPCAQAKRLCQNAVFAPLRFEAYREASAKIHQVFKEFTDKIEPLSLDEAYLDVSESNLCDGSATKMAAQIKQRILEETQLTASAGVSYNKFLAKVASDMDKPDGIYVIRPEQGEAFVATLPVGKFYGVGKVTEKKMKTLGIHTGADLRLRSVSMLQTHFGKAASYYYHIARGIDERRVISHRQRKSIGAETTFENDLTDTAEMLEQLKRLAERIGDNLASKQLQAKTLTIKVKYHDFHQVTRSKTVDGVISSYQDIEKWLSYLLAKTEAKTRSVRLLGVSVSSLVSEGSANMQQLDLM